jgi:hypothetical protein
MPLKQVGAKLVGTFWVVVGGSDVATCRAAILS